MEAPIKPIFEIVRNVEIVATNGEMFVGVGIDTSFVLQEKEHKYHQKGTINTGITYEVPHF